jgi:hypothetical protein
MISSERIHEQALIKRVYTIGYGEVSFCLRRRNNVAVLLARAARLLFGANRVITSA